MKFYRPSGRHAFLLFSTLITHAYSHSQEKDIAQLPPLHHLVHVSGPNSITLAASKLGGAGNQTIIGYKKEGHPFSLSPKTVIENYSEEVQDNILYDQSLRVLKAIETFPVVLATSSPEKLFVVRFTSRELNQLSLQPIDSNKLPAASIVNIGVSPDGIIAAAVVGNGGLDFGDEGSGIAFISLADKKEKEGEKVQKNLHQYDVLQQEPETEADLHTIQENKIPRALSLNRSSECVAINRPLNKIDNHAAIGSLNRALFYIGLNTYGASNSDAGAYAITIAQSIFGERYELTRIAPETVFTPNAYNEIVGASGSNTSVHAHHLVPMTTSTFLPYLVICGGNGDKEVTKHNVYALPLYIPMRDQSDLASVKVEEKDEEKTNLEKARTHIAAMKPLPHAGCLASRRSSINHYATPNGLLLARAFSTPATTPDDIYTTQDREVQVGAGPMLAGTIDEITIHHDVVYARVSEANQGYTPGLFSSRALFDYQGRICGWTAWQRESGIANVCNVTHDPIDATYIIAQEDGTLRKTSWKMHEHPLIETANEIVTEIGEPIQSLVSLEDNDGTIYCGILLKGTSIIIPTGQRNRDSCINLVDFNNNEYSEQALIFQSDAISKIAPLTSIALTHDGHQEWCAIGGLKGLVLTAINQQKSIEHNCKNIQKIATDEHYLYVLTNNKLERINMATSDMQHSRLDATTIATSDMFGEQRVLFYDLIASEKLILLATSAGLFRIADGCDARSIDAHPNAWTHIPLPYEQGPVVHLEGCSISGKESDVSRDICGQVYALTAFKGTKSACAHRLSIKPTTGDNQVTPYTVMWGTDIYRSRLTSSCIPFSEFGKRVFTDGKQALLLPGNANGVISGSRLPGALQPRRRIKASGSSEQSEQNNEQIYAITKDPASGCLIAATTQGLLIHE